MSEETSTNNSTSTSSVSSTTTGTSNNVRANSSTEEPAKLRFFPKSLTANKSPAAQQLIQAALDNSIISTTFMSIKYTNKQFSQELIKDLLSLNRFYCDKTPKKTIELFGQEYKDDLDRFYKRALEIRLTDLSQKSIKVQAAEIKQAAHDEFYHRHWGRRLIADICMIVSGLGLLLVALPRFFCADKVLFSQVKTQREVELREHYMKDENELRSNDDQQTLFKF